jgi:hypothetical protein
VSDPGAKEGLPPPEGQAPAAPPAEGFLPKRPERRPAESAFVRVVATAGIVGVATAVAAIMASQDVDGWVIGLVASLISVIVAAFLWRSWML